MFKQTKGTIFQPLIDRFTARNTPNRGNFVISVKASQKPVRTGQAAGARQIHAGDETKGNPHRSELT
jgi:hypothetical protein